tara:strand:+ start:1215 stop:2153 length:939 start_codon:yes stop_codon:yes gene_type:complete
MANTKITNPELFNLGDSNSATQLPVMTTTQRDAMTGLSVGEMIFNSITDKVEYWDGTKWYAISYGVAGNDGLTAATAFISYDEAVLNGTTNGLYYLNDGTRTRQYYFDLDGTENGTGTVGWTRIDSSIATPYLGQECTSSAAGITANGLITVQAQTSPLGGGSWGGCGTGFNSTYIKARKFALSNISSNSSPSYKTSYFAAYNSPTVLRSDWYGNQAGNGGYYYPGAYPFPVTVPSPPWVLYNYTSNTTQPPANPTSLANSANAEYNGQVRYGMFSGTAYDLFDTQDRIIHVGQSTYPSTAATFSMKIWFKF